jgi:nucleoside-diphosphate-sugar epimerase
MRTALVGWSGLVGGNLLAQAQFDHRFRSTDISELPNHSYDLLVCAGAPAEKWKANQDPEGDLARLAPLFEALRRVQAKKVVLISTIDVFAKPVDVNEDSPTLSDTASVYGKHRARLEQLVRDRFDAAILRLPGLFGPGLKKNVIFDLLHNNQVEKIHPGGVFQYYPLTRLWADIQICLRENLSLVHAATQPVATDRIAREIFGVELAPREGAPARYDFHSQHAAPFGGKAGSPYWMTDVQVLEEMRKFVDGERRRLHPL